MVRIAVVGASGRMGLCLLKAALAAENAELTVAVSRPDSLAIGKDAGELAGVAAAGIKVGDDLAALTDRFDVLIDFTGPRRR
jgi:dihydrodipicolinate reductase (EC 1.3.1.26)